jgi:hypothetical protein
MIYTDEYTYNDYTAPFMYDKVHVKMTYAGTNEVHFEVTSSSYDLTEEMFTNGRLLNTESKKFRIPISTLKNLSRVL